MSPNQTATLPSHPASPALTSIARVQPYLFFEGRCEEALEFYRRTLGATTTTLLRFKDSPDEDNATRGNSNQVMHAVFRVGATEILASDGRCEGTSNFAGFSLSVTLRDEAEAERVFEGLRQGGEVRMPMTRTFFSPRFGMLADRFGVAWIISVVPPTS